MLRLRTVLMVVTLVLVTPILALAQSDDESNAGVQFNFSTPGARSLGMGGSFLGSVDDATAAYSNPAGLLQLSKPEVLVEGRRWHYETPFADRGRVSGTPTGIGADTISGVSLGTTESELEGLSYAAFVMPRPTWAFSVYYHRVADFESNFTTGGIFSSRPETRLYPVRATYDLEISQAGLAFARKWDNGLTVGVGLSAYSLALDSLSQRYDFSGYAPADFGRAPGVNFQTQTGDDQQAGGSLGLLWDGGGKVSFGMVYRFGPEFDIEVANSSLSPEIPIPPRRETRFAGIFNLPDVFGAGITLRPSQALTINLDLNRVYYSEMIENLVLIFPVVQGQTVSAEDFVLDDVTEVHTGLEYLIAGRRTAVALRLGAWYDPDHRLRAESGPDLHQAQFFAGEDEFHVTGGIGFALGVLQIDAAADVSDGNTTTTISTAIRF